MNKIIRLTEPTEIIIKSLNGSDKAANRHPELFERESYEAKLKKSQRNDDWWNAYNEYLERNPVWRQKHALVIQRDKLCQGCLKAPATQAHHLKYPKDCWPGSPQWIKREKLFDLTGICDSCHEDIHPKPEIQQLFPLAA